MCAFSAVYSGSMSMRGAPCLGLMPGLSGVSDAPGANGPEAEDEEAPLMPGSVLTDKVGVDVSSAADSERAMLAMGGCCGRLY